MHIAVSRISKCESLKAPDEGDVGSTPTTGTFSAILSCIVCPRKRNLRGFVFFDLLFPGFFCIIVMSIKQIKI